MEKSTPAGRHLDIGQHNIHILVAELTGNPAMHVFVEVLTKLTAHHITEDEVRKVAKETYETHAKIAEAIIAGDAALATHLMSRHLDELAASLH